MPTAVSDNITVFFTERQSFLRHWWWLVLSVIVLTSGVLQWRHRQSQMAPLLTASTILLLTALLVGVFALLRIDTRLDTAGASFRLFPLGWKHLPWSEVTAAYVRKYSALGEYGGWGIKGFSTRNYAYNAAGNQGIQLELSDGRRILLGTQHPVEAHRALVQLGYAASPPA